MEQNEKKFGNFEEAPKVAVVENYGVMLTMKESELPADNEELREEAKKHAVCDAIAAMLYNEGLIEVDTTPSDNLDPVTGERHYIISCSLYIKTKDSDILRTGKTKFVKD
jgi:hypothetical protein